MMMMLMFVVILLINSFVVVNVSGESVQSITWVYANSLERGASFFSSIGLEEIEDLIQKKECRIFRSDVSGYLGVCNTRDAPKCSKDSQGDDVPVTITLIMENRQDVDLYRSYLLKSDANITITEAGASKMFGAYSFNFYDNDYLMGLGCYRFEAQSFDDPAFPSIPLTDRLRNQLILAGTELRESPTPSKPIMCSCEDFCSGQCFAPSCDVCDAAVWSDKSSCLNPGPLGQGLLCAAHHTNKSNAMPCCSPNGSACRLEGGNWCNCSSYPPQDPLFPPLLRSREWTDDNQCLSSSSFVF